MPRFLSPSNIPPQLAPYLPGAHVVDNRLHIEWQGHRLSSAFQPIVSFSHSRIIGHEGLVRVIGPDNRPLPPPDLFSRAERADDLLNVDRACRLIHMINARNAAGWLFLNLHPALFGTLLESDSRAFVDALKSAIAQPTNRCIIEVVEEAVTDTVKFEEGAQMLRALGVGLALDDFGAGHSNFDRVWRIRPDVVKLDRSFAVHVINDPMVRRLLPRLVSLLHEAGTLVLLEGIETLDQALIAMDADIDFGQGWFFAIPQPDPAFDPSALVSDMGRLWSAHERRSNHTQLTRRERVAPYLNAIGYSSVLLSAGLPLELAAAGFFELPDAECFYLLDSEGRQVGPNLSAAKDLGSPVLRELGRMPGARWSRRPYFRRARQHPGKPQVTRPYVSISSGRTCVTVSIQVTVKGEACVVCGDIDWEEDMSISSDYNV